MLFISFIFSFIIFVSGFCADGGADEQAVPLEQIYRGKGLWFRKPIVKMWRTAKETGGPRTVRWSKAIYGTDVEHIKAQRRQSVENMRQVVIEMDNPEPLNLIPHISHQMWITKGKQVPDTHIEATIQRCLMLGKHWRHILWVMDAEVLAPSIAALKEELPFLEVRQVDDYYLRKGETEKSHPGKVHMYGRPIFDYLYEENVFVVTTDVLRKNVVYRSSPEDVGGGLYSDMGISLSVNITPLLDHAHAAFYVHPTMGKFDLGLSAYMPGLNAMKQTLYMLDDVTPDMLGGESDSVAQLGIVGATLFHAHFAQTCGDFRTVPLLKEHHWHNTHLTSWRETNPLLGNNSFTQTVHRKSIFRVLQEEKATA